MTSLREAELLFPHWLAYDQGQILQVPGCGWPRAMHISKHSTKKALVGKTAHRLSSKQTKRGGGISSVGAVERAPCDASHAQIPKQFEQAPQVNSLILTSKLQKYGLRHLGLPGTKVGQDRSLPSRLGKPLTNKELHPPNARVVKHCPLLCYLPT